MFTIITDFMHEVVLKKTLLKSHDTTANCTKQHDVELQTVKVESANMSTVC